jgi:ABC-type lipoprotein release transport system permease subunit
MYNRLGKASVKFAFRYMRRRYRRESRIALGLFGAGIVAAVAYFATREVPEG